MELISCNVLEPVLLGLSSVTETEGEYLCLPWIELPSYFWGAGGRFGFWMVEGGSDEYITSIEFFTEGSICTE
jgi:hypothetical protein